MNEKTKEMLIIASFALKHIDEGEFEGLMLDWFLLGKSSIDSLLMAERARLGKKS